MAERVRHRSRRRGCTAVLVAAAVLVLAGCGGGGGRDGGGGGGSSSSTTSSSSSTTPVRIAVAERDPDLAAYGGIETDYGGTEGRPRVLIGGDSIAEASRARLHRRLGDDYLVKIDTVVGASWSRQTGGFDGTGCGKSPTWPCDASHGLVPGALLEDADTRPKVVVLALGTNDAWRSAQQERAAIASQEEVTAAYPDSCIVAVMATEHSEADNYDNAKAARLNAAIREQADEVVRWDVVGEQPGMTSEDDIHPTARGADTWTRLVTKAIDACAKR